MAGISSGAPRDRQRIPGVTLSLFALASSELRRDIRRLLDSRWDEPVRRRAEELASTLFDTCQRQGLPDLARSFRSVSNLVRLSRVDALLVYPELAEKLEDLLRGIDRALPKRSDRTMG